MRTLLLVLSLLRTFLSVGQDLRSIERSEVTFVSEASMERISAASIQCSGVIDLVQRTFALQVPVRSFQGFNSPLQREHFNENYLESGKYPNITFKGRVIESLDLSKPGTYRVRAKGELSVHGVMRERIIECTCVVTEDGIRVTSVFSVTLSDHAIRVPRVVQTKVASVVNVKVDIRFGPHRSAKR
ncbi:MAG: YceI family protein [Flavobacteriales bacterium]|nr:YceI family protein [Flavobacteriales bacterium]